MAYKRKRAENTRKQYTGDKSFVNDGFQNFTSRLGVGTDNNLSNGTYAFNNVTKNRQQLEAAYRGSGIVGSIVDAVAKDMTRAGITITNNSEPDEIEKLTLAMNSLGVWGDLGDAVRWGRLYGGAIAVIMVDGQKPETPLNINTVGKGQFRGIAIYDRWQVNPDVNELVDDGAEYGLPKFYNITSQNNMKIHYSRIIRFEGIKLPYFQSITEQYWGESVIERLYDRLVSFDAATMGASNLVERAYLRTVKVDGLREILGAGGKAEENLISQFHYMRMLQTNEGLTIMDGADEFQANSYSFSGLSDILLQFEQQLAGASGIPLVRLFGQSPSGLSATGESDMQMYYDMIAAEQESKLREGLHKILSVMYRSLFAKDPTAPINFTFNTLWQMTDEQKANIAKINVDTVIAAFEAGIIDEATAKRELRQLSSKTGVFTNITDEMIEEAENEPPMPTVENVTNETNKGE